MPPPKEKAYDSRMNAKILKRCLNFRQTVHYTNWSLSELDRVVCSWGQTNMVVVGRLDVTVRRDGNDVLALPRSYPCFQKVGIGIWGLSQFHRSSWGPGPHSDLHNHRGL